jgi:uncharacterized protein YjbI with pentapeptide repeats
MEKTINFYGRSNRILVEQAIKEGSVKNCQITECDLCDLQISSIRWDNAHIRDLHANDTSFDNAVLERSVFSRSSFMRTSFNKTVLSEMVFDGLTLIKSNWNETRLENTTLKNLCLQRAVFNNSRFVAASILDFEALDVKVDNCIFAHCMIGINYGTGMNGFCSANFTNCIFYNCRFEGYPLRGSRVTSSVFAYCSGQIGDEMECNNVAGIGLKGKAKYKKIERQIEARRLLEVQ